MRTSLWVNLYLSCIVNNRLTTLLVKWLRVLWFVCLFIVWYNMYITYIFYATDFEKPSLLLAVSAAVIKHVWGVAMAVIMIGIIYKHGWIAPNLCSFSGYRIIGRISYGTFICHLLVVKLLMSGSSQPIYLSDMSVVSLKLVCIQQELKYIFHPLVLLWSSSLCFKQLFGVNSHTYNRPSGINNVQHDES